MSTTRLPPNAVSSSTSPGGHVRHYVALALIGDGGDPALKREVVHGLVVRCLEEAIANPALYVSRSAG